MPVVPPYYIRHLRVFGYLYSVNEQVDNRFKTNVVVNSTGHCTWVPPVVFTSPCSVDVALYPFDTQNCTLRFGSWIYVADEMEIEFKWANYNNVHHMISGEWQVLSEYYVDYCCCSTNIALRDGRSMSSVL